MLDDDGNSGRKQMKMIFMNIGWMRNYRGLDNDKIIGGGRFVKEHGYGYEILNFKSFRGYMYGYVQSPSINIDRLGASQGDVIHNVLVIWVSTSPDGGSFIIGWYKNASVYRNIQPMPPNSERVYQKGGKKESIGYYVKAKKEDCTLLPIDERVFQIHRGRKGMGQSLLWYADRDENKEFKQKVLGFIEKRIIPKEPSKLKKGGKALQPDPLKRQNIEEAAIRFTSNHFEKIGYYVDSVEKDNVGWDLEATLNKRVLKIEVKGLSEDIVIAELTPNEYSKMKKYKHSYRVCIVCNALKKPKLRTLSYSPENQIWEDDDGNHYEVAEIMSARIKPI